jgi:hypothetical protein
LQPEKSFRQEKLVTHAARVGGHASGHFAGQGGGFIGKGFHGNFSVGLDFLKTSGFATSGK